MMINAFFVGVKHVRICMNMLKPFKTGKLFHPGKEKSSNWQRAMNLLSQALALGRGQMDIISCNAAISVCENRPGW